MRQVRSQLFRVSFISTLDAASLCQRRDPRNALIVNRSLFCHVDIAIHITALGQMFAKLQGVLTLIAKRSFRFWGPEISEGNLTLPTLYISMEFRPILSKSGLER